MFLGPAWEASVSGCSPVPHESESEQASAKKAEGGGFGDGSGSDLYRPGGEVGTAHILLDIRCREQEVLASQCRHRYQNAFGPRICVAWSQVPETVKRGQPDVAELEKIVR